MILLGKILILTGTVHISYRVLQSIKEHMIKPEQTKKIYIESISLLLLYYVIQFIGG